METAVESPPLYARSVALSLDRILFSARRASRVQVTFLCTLGCASECGPNRARTD